MKFPVSNSPFPLSIGFVNKVFAIYHILAVTIIISIGTF